MSQHADEPIENDPLFEFANESERIPQVVDQEPGSAQSPANVDVAPPAPPDEAAAASSAALSTRLDRLEQANERRNGQLALLRSEVATLVATIDDIKKREVRRATYAARLPPTPSAPVPRSRTAPAVVGVLAGLAIGLLGWMTWHGDPIAVADATPAPVVAEAPALIEDVAPAPAPAPAQPAITLASTNVVQPPTREVPARESVETHRTDTAYVGTLSIDASPGGAVFINRKPAGQTPLRVNNLKAGSHLVWIERDGYRRFTRVVQVPADRVSRLFADLEPLTP